MLIDKSPDLKLWVDGTLKEIRDISLPYVNAQCTHCGCHIRFPIIARQIDIDDFALLIETAEKIMDKYNINACLMAEIRAECKAEIKRRKDERRKHE